ncbi:MAG TPA: ion channel [Anaeromyxobacteraceae bacterium]
MRPSKRSEVLRSEGYEIRVIGGPAAGLRDLYHSLLRVPWWATLVTIVGGYLLLNTLFAVLFVAVGGVANAKPGSFLDAFFFSVQTMGTIGYGTMYPATRLANAIVVVESVTGLVATALATGLVFVRFSQTRARVAFCSRVAIGPMDGAPTLMMRIGNERRGRIVDATFRLTLMRTTRTGEGVPVYRIADLPLVRDGAPALTRSWTVLHRIAPGTPLHGDTPESLAAGEVELTLAVTGTDETSLQPVHAQHTWMSGSIVWGARLADVLSETPDGNMLLDLRRFHDLSPTGATPEFPYSADLSAGTHPGPAGERRGA